ncbi:MAG: rhomboid family intramembrane serine protease [Syntrophomonadaceae bacterium]|nr:rhomboid family intramembrane serine protease [Syntrophomonadaceae bacterium]
MIPLRDNTHSDSFPVITVIIIALNTLIFMYEVSLGEAGMNELAYIFGLVPIYYSDYHVPWMGYLPFVTSTFLHGSWMHLIGNMWVLWLFGDNVEDQMGKLRFVGFYLLCGLLAGITHFLLNLHSEIPVIGASGAVAGVMGAYFLMFRKASVLTFIPPFFLISVPAWVFLGFWALSQVFGGAAGLLSTGAEQSIAFWAHVGGFAAGMLLYRFFLRPGRPNYPGGPQLPTV